MKLSVIIPCYNAADTIGEQLEALAGQQCDTPWEIIVADNGSTDGSESLVREYQKKIPQLKLIDASGRKGPAHARNTGARAATGDTLLFCDADDVVGEGWLAAMARGLTVHEFVAGRCEGEKLNCPKQLRGRNVSQQSGLPVYNYPEFLPHAGAGNLGIKRYLHDSINGFNESMPFLEDTDYCWRAQLAGATLYFEPDALVHVRLRPSFWRSLKQARTWGKYNVYIYKKYLAHGMPKLGYRRSIKTWVRLFKQLPRIRNSANLARWLWLFSWGLGRIEGSIKFRVWGL